MPAEHKQRPTRRQLLGLGAAGLGVAGAGGVAAGMYQGWLPGRIRLGSLLGLDGGPVAMPEGPAGVVRSEQLATSHRLGGIERWAWSVPPGHAIGGLPVVVVLHGWSDDHRHAFDQLGLAVLQARLAEQMGRPFVLASLDGGHGYWHSRVDGNHWAEVVADLVVELARRGAATNRIGLIGWSMGGYGALRLAAHELKGRVAAVGTMSTALYPDWEHCPQGTAFDNPEDFTANGLVDRSPLHGLPVHVACGLNDPYLPRNRELADELVDHVVPGDLQRLFVKGAHDANFWRRVAPEQLRFIVDRLGN